MTVAATDAEKLAELDEDARRAWSAYSERIRELTGPAYDTVEDESWIELQTRLEELDRQRRALAPSSDTD